MVNKDETTSLVSKTNQAAVVFFLAATGVAFLCLVLSIVIPSSDYNRTAVHALIAITLACFIAAMAWPFLRPSLEKGEFSSKLADSLSRVAANAVSWLLLVVLLGLTITGLAVYRRATEPTPLSEYTWLPLTKAQKNEIATAIRQFPNHRVIILRPDVPDCIALATDFADMFLDEKELLTTPYSLASSPFSVIGFGPGSIIALGFSPIGITIYAPSNSDRAAASLQTSISEALHYPVETGPINPGLYGPLAPDLVLSIGSKKRPSFYQTGVARVPAGASSISVRIHGVSSYAVTAWTNWGANTKVTETTSDHFTVQFSSSPPTPFPTLAPTPVPTVMPAPIPVPIASSTASPKAMATPTTSSPTPAPLPIVGELHWLAFHP